MNYKTREEWLRAGVKAMSPWLVKHGHSMPDVWDVGVAEPHRKVIGRCYPEQHLFVMGHIVEPVAVLATVLHEMLHAAVGIVHKHKGPFAILARAVGLEGKLTATYAKEGTPLHEALGKLALKLGEYPHRQMMPMAAKGSGGGGWLRYHSPTIPGYKVQISPVQLLRHGAPKGPDGVDMEEGK